MNQFVQLLVRLSYSLIILLKNQRRLIGKASKARGPTVRARASGSKGKCRVQKNSHKTPVPSPSTKLHGAETSFQTQGWIKILKK